MTIALSHDVIYTFSFIARELSQNLFPTVSLSVVTIAHVHEMIKWVGSFDYKSSAIGIINNTYVWLVTPYFRTVEPVKINTLVMEQLTILCDDGFI